MFNLMHGAHIARGAVAVALACGTIAGCANKTNVSATGDVPAQYTHVYVTAQEIWFNSNAAAGPDDTTWVKFVLNTPTTVDLMAVIDGALAQITTDVPLPAGTYNQIRLLPVDASAALVASAQSAGAIYNSEADYTDSAGTTHRTALELQNPEKGIGIATTLTITNNVSGVLSGTTSTTNTASTNDPTSAGSATGLIPSTDTTSNDTSTAATTTVAATNTTSTPISIAINVDGARDLVPFTFGSLTGVTGVLLNPHATAFDTSAVGAVQGTLTLSDLTEITAASGRFNIQVTAESLSTDGTRHVAVNSAPVRSDGSFVIYPLATSSSSPASYDLVIHGPGIATIIIRGVTVNVGDPTVTAPVSVGTVVPRAALSFTVNLTSGSALQAGALVGFYQTLPGSSEVPYLIEERVIDPFSRTFSADQAVSTETLDFGTFASGTDVSLSSATATEGAATYRVSATAPLFADGGLTSTISAPGAGRTGPVLFSLPTLNPVAGSATDSISISVSESVPGRYNQGELIISRDGAIVATGALDTIFAQGARGTLAIAGLPGGTFSSSLATGVYYVSVRAWNSSNPSGTLTRQTFPEALDLRNSSVTGYSVVVD